MECKSLAFMLCSQASKLKRKRVNNNTFLPGCTSLSLSPLAESGLLKLLQHDWPIFFWFGGILGSASGAEFPVSLSNHVGFTPRLLYSSTHHSPESFTHLKTGSRCLTSVMVRELAFSSWHQRLTLRWNSSRIWMSFLSSFARLRCKKKIRRILQLICKNFLSQKR